MRNFQLIKIAFLFVLLSQVSLSQVVNEVSKDEKACGETSAKMFILGTYHMNNPKLDTFNLNADNVLTEKRQKEMVELIKKLERFSPSKIAIEADYKSTHWQKRYQKYRNDKYRLGKNEIEQIGFRLAKRLEHKTLYPVDYPMFMSGLLRNEVENRKRPNTKKTKAPKTVKLTEADKRLRRLTILQNLIRANDPKSIERSHRQYMEMMRPNFFNPAIYHKADLVSNWYKRNLRMFSNLNRISKFDGKERVLLIVGAGHLKILRDFVRDSPQFCLIDTSAYLGK